jgi:hypothetical protein
VPAPGQQHGQTHGKQQGQTQAQKHFNQNNTSCNALKTGFIVAASLGAPRKLPSEGVTKSGVGGEAAAQCALCHVRSANWLAGWLGGLAQPAYPPGNPLPACAIRARADHSTLNLQQEQFS